MLDGSMERRLYLEGWIVTFTVDLSVMYVWRIDPRSFHSSDRSDRRRRPNRRGHEDLALLARDAGRAHRTRLCAGPKRLRRRERAHRRSGPHPKQRVRLRRRGARRRSLLRSVVRLHEREKSTLAISKKARAAEDT